MTDKIRFEQEAKEIIKLTGCDILPKDEYGKLVKKIAKKIQDILDKECQDCEYVDPADYVPEPPYDWHDLD